MKNSKFICIFLTIVLIKLISLGAHFIGTEIETGIVWSGYNDIRIPGDGGTDFSFSEELKTKETSTTRIRFFIKVGEKSTLILLYAPLELEASGSLDNDLIFFEKVFPAKTELKGKYKFNSYRLTYVYDWKQRKKFNLSLGFTVKIRDAAIEISTLNGISSRKTNVGFVPIFYFRYEYFFSRHFTLLCEGDALAAPQGRAEDIFLGLNIRELGTRAPISLKFGYRILEGGADNEEVYNFTLINYIVFGVLF